MSGSRRIAAENAVVSSTVITEPPHSDCADARARRPRLLAGFGEQPLVLGVGEGREEILRPVATFPGKRFTARLQDEPVAALAAHPAARSISFSN